MSTLHPSDDDARRRDAAQRAEEVPSDDELTGSTHAALIVITIGLSSAAVAVVCFFGAPAALDTPVMSIVMTILLVAQVATCMWTFVKRFRVIPRGRQVLTPLTRTQRKLLRAYVKDQAEPSATEVPVLMGHLRQQRQGLINAGLIVGFFIGLSSFQIALSAPSGRSIFWFCYLVGGSIAVGVGVLVYRRYGTALRRVSAVITSEPVES